MAMPRDKVNCVKKMLQLGNKIKYKMSRNALHKDFKTRTKGNIQHTRVFNAVCCSNVQNTHLNFASSIFGRYLKNCEPAT